MGPPKQRWTSEEEAALRAGVGRHGVGKWRAILKDPHFGSTLRCRSNVDLKDKWRNMNVLKKTQPTPKNGDHALAITTVTSDIDNEIVDVKPIAAVPSEALNSSNPKKSQLSLDMIIMEAVKNLNEPTGSHRTSIANYIEEQYWPSSNFEHSLSALLKDLTADGKLIKVKRKYRIAPSSPLLEERSPKMLLLEDVQAKPFKIGRNDSKTLTRSLVDAELARMATMTAEEAAAAAARAVEEAEAIMAEAEAAAKEAEAAEVDAQAAQALAKKAFLALKNRNATKLVAQA
ncbi:hypothetical protein EJB05_05460 [Eragrostis curvula]|uniref:MYB transcription factor n=1 Tax=Eragrostis curvula TaxID=38414 RepID=A0A5J9WEX9_9POAL|nr:hypothetical protein EJB05_05460 [Eragrostis curvula]